MRRFPKIGLLADERGVAAIEFALILPIMLLLYLGSMEASALYSMDRRVQTITGSIGDLVSRSDEVIGSAQLDDYFRAAQTIVLPNPVAGLVQTVSLLRINDDGEARVDWSRTFEGGDSDHQTGYAKDSEYELPEEIEVLLEEGQYLVVSEVSYPYTPLLGLVFTNEVQLYRENFYLPRFGERIRYIQ